MDTIPRSAMSGLTMRHGRKTMLSSSHISSYRRPAVWQTVVSTKGQVVIPKAVREQVRLQPGQRVTVVLQGGIISLVPQVPVTELRGIAKGIDVGEIREEGDRL
jgi:AbrB family looped-hinge helix DNA binding protein